MFAQYLYMNGNFTLLYKRNAFLGLRPILFQTWILFLIIQAFPFLLKGWPLLSLPKCPTLLSDMVTSHCFQVVPSSSAILQAGCPVCNLALVLIPLCHVYIMVIFRV